MIPTKKWKSLQTLIKEADQVFSEYVRRSEADEHGYITCLICGMRVHWKQADNAHFIDRDQMTTRYDDLNCWPTDRHCNRFDDNHRDRYEKALVSLIGQSEVDSLFVRSRSLRKFFPWEIEEMITEWKDKISKLKG